ncbi:hypothetical protein OEZ86_008974 [Tetradesmus obliquus]|nr:hypothetical protein OEZ86_008974 [Tetradesmus obliquus]
MEVTLEPGSDVLCVADYNEPPSAKPFDAGLAAGVAVAVVVTFIVLAAAAYYAYKQHTQREKQQDGLVRYSSSFEGAGNRPFAGIASKIKHAIGTSPLPPIAAATAATAAAAAPAAFKAHSFNSSTTSKQVAVTVSDGGMVVGFTGEELCSALQEVQHVVTHKLIIAVEDSPLAADPFAAWLAEGMDEVQRRVCKADYAQSHMFVRDWQTHCMLGWLHDSIWSQQVPPHTLLGVQAPSGVTDKQSARWLLAQLRIDTHYPPFKTATADVAQHLLKSVLQHAPEHVAEEAARYYAQVLLQVMASALRLFLQVRGTADGLSIFLPGRVAASTPALPEAAVRYKDYQQQQQQQLRVCVLDSQPGALAVSQTGAVTVWAPAAATRIELL